MSEITYDEKDEWIIVVRDPAHMLDLALKYVRKYSVFDWF